MKHSTHENQLNAFIAAYTPEIGRLATLTIAKMRSILPGATELVYDNYNALAIGFGPSEKSSEAILSIALYPRWVSLFFLQGADLHDPKKLLKGSGKKVRHIVLNDENDLDRPEIRKLIEEAVRKAAKPINKNQRRQMIIKSISEKQRPRRPLS